LSTTAERVIEAGTLYTDLSSGTIPVIFTAIKDTATLFTAPTHPTVGILPTLQRLAYAASVEAALSWQALLIEATITWQLTVPFDALKVWTTVLIFLATGFTAKALKFTIEAIWALLRTKTLWFDTAHLEDVAVVRAVAVISTALQAEAVLADLPRWAISILLAELLRLAATSLFTDMPQATLRVDATLLRTRATLPLLTDLIIRALPIILAAWIGHTEAKFADQARATILISLTIRRR